MNFVLFLFLIFNATLIAHNFDYSAQLGARTRPQGASLMGSSGYNYKVWGDSNNGNFVYGYLRPFTNLSTSGVVNSGELGLDLYPISIFGITSSYKITDRLIDIDHLSCDQIRCMGTTGKLLFRSNLILGYKDYFLVFLESFENQKIFGSQNQNFGDEYSVLTAHSIGDWLQTSQLILGLKINSQYQAGLIFDYENMKITNDQSEMQATFIKKSFADTWSILIGAGAYKSDHFQRNFTGFFLLSWNGKTGLSLF